EPPDPKEEPENPEPPPNREPPKPPPLLAVRRPWMASRASWTSAGSMPLIDTTLTVLVASLAAWSRLSISFLTSSCIRSGQATTRLFVRSSTPTDRRTDRGLPLASTFWLDEPRPRPNRLLK